MNSLSDLTLLSATFNRHDFTVTMLESFWDIFKNIPQTVILDNSTETKFPNVPSKYITVIDNTNYKHSPNYNQPSKNHCASLDWAFHNVIKTRYCLLCDNDILFKPAVLNLMDEYHKYDAVGEVGYDRVPPVRLYPYFCILDMDFIRNNKVRYFDSTRCMIDNATMDTGCSFYQDMSAARANIKRIKLSDYVIHLKGGTLRNKDINELILRR